MLNLAPTFDHANEALTEFGTFLRVGPLPTAVYLMQRDVINHYRHALTHYFPISLSEPYLQNSSIGTPYEKWRKFSNDNFDMLAFAIHNLLRYTSRLGYETVCIGLEQQNRRGEIKTIMDAMSPEYTAVLCDINVHGRKIGIEILPDNALHLTPFGHPLTHERIEIRDRSVLQSLCENGHAEIDTLQRANAAFARLVNEFNADHDLTGEFSSLNRSWWV